MEEINVRSRTGAMRLISFSGSNIHGYLSFNIKFNRDITFLTGINGSGKTSIVRCIIGLITPSPYILSNISFDSIEIAVENNNQKHTISCRKVSNFLEMKVSGIDSVWSFQPYLRDPDVYAPASSDPEVAHYRTLVEANSSHEVLKFIQSLPTPMFIGLERRGSISGDVNERMAPQPPSLKLDQDATNAGNK